LSRDWFWCVSISLYTLSPKKFDGRFEAFKTHTYTHTHYHSRKSMSAPLVINITLCDAKSLWVEKALGTNEYELRSAVDIVLKPGRSSMVSTGIEMALPPGIFGMITTASEQYDVVSTTVKSGCTPRALRVKVRNPNMHSDQIVRAGDVIAVMQLFMEYAIHVNSRQYAPTPTPPPNPSTLPSEWLVGLTEENLWYDDAYDLDACNSKRLPIFQSFTDRKHAR
jgi:dUTPase